MVSSVRCRSFDRFVDTDHMVALTREDGKNDKLLAAIHFRVVPAENL